MQGGPDGTHENISTTKCLAEEYKGSLEEAAEYVMSMDGSGTVPAEVRMPVVESSVGQ